MDNTIKIFRPKGIVGIGTYILATILLGFTIVSGVYVFIESEETWFTVLVTIFAISATVFETRWFIALLCKKIIIGVDAVYIRKNNSMRSKQREVNVLYAEINGIRMVWTRTNPDWITLFYPRSIANICIECVNDNSKMIIIDGYSKNQIIKIINEIIKRAQAVGKLLDYPPGEEIMKQAMDEYGGDKKKKK